MEDIHKCDDGKIEHTTPHDITKGYVWDICKGHRADTCYQLGKGGHTCHKDETCPCPAEARLLGNHISIL